MENQKSRKVLLIVYLVVAFLSLISYVVGDVLAFSSVGTKSVISLLFVLMSILFCLIAFGIYLFTILFFHYRKRYLFLLLAPFLGGMFFAAAALAKSKTEPQDFRLQGKIWNFAALFGLLALDQTVGGFFQFFASSSKLVVWQIILDLIFFVATIVYFIYWGRKRVNAWQLRNFWSSKWLILIGIVGMIAWNYAWPAIVGLFHSSIPLGDNQSALNQLASNTPTWLMWLHVAIGAPVMEESIFRLGIYELISPKHPKVAFFASAIIFAFLHMANGSIGDWRVWGVYLGMGLVLSGIYYKARKVEATATIHFLWNGLATWILPS